VVQAQTYDTKKGPLAGGGRQDAIDISVEQDLLFSALKHRLRYGAVLPEHLTDTIRPTELNEEPFHFIPNVPNDYDGRHWPILLSDGVVIGENQGGSWIDVYWDNPGMIAAKFKLRRISREFSHIDFRFRRQYDPEVLREYRHVPEDGEIALGQTINPAFLNPGEESYEHYLVHAVAMDAANHPSDGICSYINVHWMRTPPPEVEELPDDYYLYAMAAEPMEPMPPMPNDPVCENWGSSPGARWGLLPRNVYIRHGTYGWWVEPSTVSISTSGESLYVNNYDEAPHRFVTTSTSYLGILGAVGPAERELDTGLIQPGGQHLVTLPTGLPMPYWFNLVEVFQDDSGNITGTNVEGKRIHIMVFNPDCIKD
jgi:hypothetical protein